MAKSLAQLRKLGACVCGMTGILNAERVVAEDGVRSVKATLCDQHPKGFANKTLDAMEAHGFKVVSEVGKAREPVDD